VFPLGIVLVFHRLDSRPIGFIVKQKFPIGNFWRQDTTCSHIRAPKCPACSRTGTP
jgi:hypothetical protein